MSFEGVIEKLRPFSDTILSQGKKGELLVEYKISTFIEQLELLQSVKQLQAEINESYKKIQEISLTEDFDELKSYCFRNMKRIDKQYTACLEQLKISRDGALLDLLGYYIMEGYPSYKAKENQYPTPLKEAVYDALVQLAKLLPENKLDIPEEEKVFVSTGHQFNLKELIEFNRSRKPNAHSSEETEQNKYFIAPIPIYMGNPNFSPTDLAHIQKTAKTRGLELADDLVERQEKLADRYRNNFFAKNTYLSRALFEDPVNFNDSNCSIF